MNKRLKFHDVLLNLLGTPNVYFQPPNNFKMKYPCITYSLMTVNTMYANDRTYGKKSCYLVTVIDSNPDSPIPDKIGNLPFAQFDRRYVSDNLNHTAYTVYY